MVVGGEGNTAVGPRSNIVGGKLNYVAQRFGSVGGGYVHVSWWLDWVLFCFLECGSSHVTVTHMTAAA